MTNGENVAVRIDLAGTFAISYGNGPFHPAIRSGVRVMYWPNVKFDNEDDAYIYAGRALYEAWERAEEYAKEWNIWTI